MSALLLLVSLSWAQAPEGPLVDAVEAELERASQLSLPEAPPIYHLRYHLLSLDQVDVRAAHGALIHASDQPLRGLGVELRVGDPGFDNTGFGGWQNGFGLTGLADHPTPLSVRQDAWRLTDRAYKQAVEQYARKAAQFTPPEDYPGDYTLTGAQVDDLGVAEVGEMEPLRELALELSAELSGLDRGEVWVGHEAGYHLIVDTEGTRVRRPSTETTVRVVAHHRAEDGLLLTDQLLWTVARPEDLPPPEQMQAQARQVSTQLLELAQAPPLDEEYVGPVLFEDEAATDFFRYLLIPQLEGTPGEVPFDSWFGDLGRDKDPVRLLRRVLPVGWSAVDDPMADPQHASAYSRDMEGTPAQAVQLVEDGIVRDLLMSRVPRKGLEGTNGHARGRPGSRTEGRVTQLDIQPDKRLSERKLRKKALRMASAYDRDWVVVVRRLQEPSVRMVGATSWPSDDSALPLPVAIYKLYADGREEPLRGAAFAGVQRFVLRDVQAAGEQVTASFLAPASGGDSYAFLGPTEGMPTRISAPEVLIGELELVPTPGDPDEVPVLPRPPASP